MQSIDTSSPAYLIAIPGPQPWTTAIGELRAAIAALTTRQRDNGRLVAGGSTPTLVRCAVTTRSLSPLAWLRRQRLYPRLYWASRDGQRMLAGAGCALQFDSENWAGIDHPLAPLGIASDASVRDALRWFVTGRFATDATPAAEWEEFGTCRAYLPLFELGEEEGRSWLACNLVIGAAPQATPPTTPQAAADPARMALAELARWAEESGPPAMADVTDSSARCAVEFDDRAAERATWAREVKRLLRTIAAERPADGLQKVVLARTLRGVASRAPDSITLLDRLAVAQPSSFRFLVQPTPDAAFVGASPERLYRRAPGLIESDALAGTRPRGETPDADAHLADELRRDGKERREQRLVEGWLRTRLAGLGVQLEVGEAPQIMRLQRVQHLWTRLQARPRSAVSDAALLHALHPTPAVCGVPAAPAREWIRRTERFDRGLYAGPIGCRTGEEAEFAVAIRSALLRGREVRLFAGAGILPGSSPAQEWRETADKMQLLRALLGGTD